MLGKYVMIRKRILSLKDFTLRTTAGGEYQLSVDQVEIVEFGNEMEFRNLLPLGSFVEADPMAAITKPILVLHPPKHSTPNTLEDMSVPEVQTHVYLPECDLECGTREVIEFHKRMRAEG